MTRDRQAGPTEGHPRRRTTVAPWLAAGTLVASSVLLFSRLGGYALWEDEAVTALHAEGVWRTGDTTAVVGHNVVGYREGTPLVGLRERYTSPLASYMAAPFVGLLGRDPLAARLPSAVCGLLTVAVMLRCARGMDADAAAWGLLAIGILGNASLFLFSRQCRYYGVATLATTTGIYGYVLLLTERRKAVLATSCVVLCAANYLDYAAFLLALAVDYAAWGRRSRRLSGREWCVLLVPQLAAAAALVSVWNPLGKGVVDYESFDWLAERPLLFWWNVRDLNACEFGVLPLLVLAPLVAAWRTGRGGAGPPAQRPAAALLVRGPVALLVYLAAVAVLSPQPVGATTVADVRYLAPVIPLCIAVGVAAVRLAMPAGTWAPLAVGVLAFGTNLLHGGILAPGRLHSTAGRFVGELARPPGDPYTPVARWIRGNVPEGRSVLVVPGNMAYPLMYHAPGAVYAWQFPGPPRGPYRALDPIHFRGAVPPDYLVTFGSPAGGGGPTVRLRGGDGTREDWRRDYQRLATIPHFWKDLHRPELFWRTFEPVTDYPPSEAIFIYRRVDGRPARARVGPGSSTVARRSESASGRGGR